MAIKKRVVRHLVHFAIGLLVGTAFLVVAAWAATAKAETVVIISRRSGEVMTRAWHSTWVSRRAACCFSHSV